MTTVTQGTTSSYTFAANEMATLALTTGQQARVEVVDGATGKTKYGAASSVSETFGPFNAGDLLTVTSIRGSVVYTISTYVPPALGTIQSVNGKTSAAVVLTSGDIGAVGIPVAWAASAAGGTPLLTSGTATLGASYQNTTAGYTTFTVPIDGIPGVQFNDVFECLTAGTWTLQPANVQSAAQIAAGATTGVVAQDASKNLYYTDGTPVTLGGSAPSTTNVLKGNGSGGISTAVPGTDYLKPAVIQCGIAIGLPPSGSTVGASGAAFTSSVAFDQVYSSGVWLRFNAAEIAVGQTAGFYWVVMSSTTLGTVYNNTYTPGGSFAPPGSPTAFTTNAGGTTAGTVASIQALNYSMPSATLGLNGVIRYSGTLRHNNSAGTKQLIPYIGATNSAWFVCTGTTSIGGGIPILAWNTGVANRQIIYAEAGAPVSTVSQVATIDTASGSAVSVALNLKTGTATDYAIMVLGKIEVFPA